jgi:hypothetical protein
MFFLFWRCLGRSITKAERDYFEDANNIIYSLVRTNLIFVAWVGKYF